MCVGSDLVEFFEWFVEIDHSNDKRKDLFSKPGNIANHEAAFESNEDNNEEGRPQTDTTSNCPIVRI